MKTKFKYRNVFGKLIAALIAISASTVSYSQDKGIVPLFTAGDSALFRYDVISPDGDTVSANVGMKVLFATGVTADVEFNTTSVAGWDNGNILPRLLNDIQSFCRPVIEYQNGRPVRVLNMNELKEATGQITRQAIDTILAQETIPTEFNDSLKAIVEGLLPLFVGNITHQSVIQQYANMMMPPMRVGPSTEKKDNMVVVCSLEHGNVEGEFNLSHKTIVNYNKQEIEAIAEGKKADTNGLMQLFGGGTIGAEIVKMADDVSITVDRHGVVLRNGVPKDMVTTRIAKITMASETTEIISKSVVKLLSEYGLTEARQDFDDYSQIVAAKDKDCFLICYDFPTFGWITRKISTDLATALFGTSGMTIDKACKEYLSPFTIRGAWHSANGLMGLTEGTRKRLNKECVEYQTFAIDWKGIVCGCYASCVVRTDRKKLKEKGGKTETTKALLWNLKTGKLLTMEDVFTPSVISEIAALGGGNHQVFMDVNGKLVLLFNKDGKQLEATFSFLSNEEVFNSQFAELVSEDAKRVEQIFSKGDGRITVNSKTGELLDLADKIGRRHIPRNTTANIDRPSVSQGITSNEGEKQALVGDDIKVFDVVEQMPSFPGGPSALFEYLSRNITYPVVAEENGIQGRVIVDFVVERDGSIADVNIVKSVDPSLDKEAMRVIKSMPRWIPGKQKGETVRVKYTVPVTFKLQETAKKKKK